MATSQSQLAVELRELEDKVARLQLLPHTPTQARELEDLKHRIEELQGEILGSQGTQQIPTAMDRVKLARHPDRPYALDFIKELFTDFHEIHGDRRYADDPAIVCGFAYFNQTPVMVIGQQKANLDSRKMADRKYRNFGMPKPEGYRKALRVMQLAAKFNRPIITLIDTPGAYPGIDAEERGQAEAIARNLIEMARLPVPIIATVIGEGGSGGALAIGVADRVNMLENAVYSVITPEGCAAILWKDSAKADRAAASMKITAGELKVFNLIDDVVPEPGGGAHINYQAAAEALRPVLARQLAELGELSVAERLSQRYEKFRRMGAFEEL
ncbi:MAG: acetyl-CoA carboxylase carboxyltransferase subunit alpha [Blastocatellia bacterium]|nr:acetyl-CoA carboxylase carboxyltransferase subunit alpha [Blastocatellia bacterium]